MTEDKQIETEINNNGGTRIDKQPDSLDEYEFGFDDAFVRWHPWGDERADDDVWAVSNIRWQFKVSWIVDRDMTPTREAHRVYELLSRETFDTVEVSERELASGDWKHIEDVDGVEI